MTSPSPSPSITVEELQDSREIVTGANASATFRYIVRGTADESEALIALRDASPSSWGTLVRASRQVRPIFVEVEQPERCIWEGTVSYAKYSRSEPPATGDSVFSFDTGGGTQHITQSLATTGVYPPGADRHGGAIGVTGEGRIEGVDITVPIYNFSETHYIAAEEVTLGYKLTLASLTGKVNDAPWKGFSGGEVLFLGASGSRRGTEDWEITFRFAASPNRTGITIGSITGISKKGWEYLWVLYETVEGDEGAVKRPKAVYVEQVYEYANFALLGIGD